MHTSDEEKKRLRQSIKHTLSALSAAQKAEWSERIMQKVEAHPAFKEARNVLLFHSLPDEPSTHTLIRRCAAEKHVYLPAVVSPTEMEIHAYSSEADLQRGAFGIMEPVGAVLHETEIIDLIVVPGLAFDRHGHRMGRGKGYYDRFIARFGEQRPCLIGVCFPPQRFIEIPFAPHDATMDYVISAD